MTLAFVKQSQDADARDEHRPKSLSLVMPSEPSELLQRRHTIRLRQSGAPRLVDAGSLPLTRPLPE
jgi:hypothetical protein